MTIATNNLRQLERHKTEQQQTAQHSVKDRGRTVSNMVTLGAGWVQESATATKPATWEHPQFGDTTKTTPFETDKTRAAMRKTVTWKTPIVDSTAAPPFKSGAIVEDAYNTVQSKYNKTFKGRMRPNPCIRHHPAYETLLEYATDGCPVDCGETWSRIQLEAAIDRGNHASAQDPQAAKCLREEALEKVAQGSARIVKWTDICDEPHPNLKISPLAAVPHKSRIYRAILDLSFQLRVGKI